MSNQNMSKNNNKFEEAISELEQIVKKLEQGELNLDESVKFFQKGIGISKQCSKMLDDAENRITVLIEDGREKMKEVPFMEGRD